MTGSTAGLSYRQAFCLSQSTVNTASTVNLPLDGQCPWTDGNGADAEGLTLMTTAGTLTGFLLKIPSRNGNLITEDLTITLYKNGVAASPAVAFSVAGDAAAPITDTTQQALEVAVAAGDYLSWRCTQAVGTVTNRLMVACYLRV